MRSFKDDVTLVLAQNDLKGTQLTFPTWFTQEFKDTSIEVMSLNVRASNSLKHGNIFTMGTLLEKLNDLPKLRNCGAGSVKEIKNAFLQAWYETLEPEEVTEFWEEFIRENCV